MNFFHKILLFFKGWHPLVHNFSCLKKSNFPRYCIAANFGQLQRAAGPRICAASYSPASAANSSGNITGYREAEPIRFCWYISPTFLFHHHQYYHQHQLVPPPTHHQFKQQYHPIQTTAGGFSFFLSTFWGPLLQILVQNMPKYSNLLMKVQAAPIERKNIYLSISQ